MFFLFFNNKNMCGYSLEESPRGTANEYPQSIFFLKNKKIIMWIPHLIQGAIQIIIRLKQLFQAYINPNNYF